MTWWKVRPALVLPAVGALVLWLAASVLPPAGAHQAVGAHQALRGQAQVIGHVGGVVRAVLPGGDYLLWGKGAELEVWTADGATRLGGALLSGIIEDIYLDGSTAYAATGLAGLDVVGLADPASPSLVRHIPLPAFDPDALALANSVVVHDSYAYVAVFEAGLWVIDLAESTPSGTTLGSYLSEVRLAGNHLLAWDNLSGYNDGYEVWDISDPAQPQRLGLAPSLGRVAGLQLAGGHLFIANEHGQFEIRAWNPAEPLAASLVAELDLGQRLSDVAISEDGQSAFVAAETGLIYLDVADRTQPALEDTLAGAIGFELETRAGQVFVAAGQGALRILAFDGQALAPGFERGLPGASLSGALADGHLFLAQDEQGIARLNVEQPTQPTVTGTVALGGWTQSVALSDSGLAATYDNQLAVLDPASLAVLGSVSLPDTAYTVVVLGSTAFVAAGYGGVCVVDLATASAPELLGCVETADEARDVALLDSTLFVAEANNGVTVRDANQPETLPVIGHYAEARAYAVAADGSQVFASDAGASPRLLILDYTAGGLSLAGEWAARGFVHDAQAAGERLFVADKVGLQVLLRGPDGGLTEWAAYNSPGTANQVLVAGNVAYLIDGGNGVVVLSVPGEPAEETPEQTYRVFLPVMVSGQ